MAKRMAGPFGPATHLHDQPTRYRNPWGVDYRTARRYGYPLVALTPVEALECEVASLTARVEALEALQAGMALLGAGE